MNRRSIYLLILFWSVVLMQCQGPTDSRPLAQLRELTPEEIQLAQSSDRFGLKLFREIVRQEPGQNIFISPLSVSMALGMTANGAAGATLDSMRSTLELGDLTEDESNAAYQSLVALLTQADPRVQFDVANSIWYRQEWTFKEGFYQRCRDYFNAVVQGLNFSDPASADIINGWVKENTQDKINEIVDKPIDPAIVMFLINAIYFNGTWTYEFDPQDTKDDQFTQADGTQASCRMMEQEADLPYMANDLFQAADLPYGDGLFSMTVLLPKQDVHIDSLVALLTPENWQSWMGNLDSAAVLLQLPKFTLEYELEMKEVLTALGMGLAFQDSVADFIRMIEPAGLIWIAKVKHKTFVRVDEEGTEAAAITSVEMVFESVGSGLISMRVDRPFIFVIRERTSATLLFMGKIVEPLWDS